MWKDKNILKKFFHLHVILTTNLLIMYITGACPDKSMKFEYMLN